MPTQIELDDMGRAFVRFWYQVEETKNLLSHRTIVVQFETYNDQRIVRVSGVFSFGGENNTIPYWSEHVSAQCHSMIAALYECADSLARYRVQYVAKFGGRHE